MLRLGTYDSVVSFQSTSLLLSMTSIRHLNWRIFSIFKRNQCYMYVSGQLPNIFQRNLVSSLICHRRVTCTFQRDYFFISSHLAACQETWLLRSLFYKDWNKTMHLLEASLSGIQCPQKIMRTTNAQIKLRVLWCYV